MFKREKGLTYTADSTHYTEYKMLESFFKHSVCISNDSF